MQVAAVVDWFGPYSRQEAIKQAKVEGFSKGLYVAVGSMSRTAYIGLSRNLPTRLYGRHAKLDLLSEEGKFWLGEVCSFGIAGRKKNATDRQLNLVEWVHAYFVKECDLNTRKKIHAPREPVTVVNRWWYGTDFGTPHRRPYSWWPSVIDFVGEEYGVRKFFKYPHMTEGKR